MQEDAEKIRRGNAARSMKHRSIHGPPCLFHGSIDTQIRNRIRYNTQGITRNRGRGRGPNGIKEAMQ